MKAKHAREIRKGILAAKTHRPDTLTILNSRYYSRLAFWAFETYLRRYAVKHYDYQVW